jgi:hypothetical protein
MGRFEPLSARFWEDALADIAAVFLRPSVWQTAVSCLSPVETGFDGAPPWSETLACDLLSQHEPSWQRPSDPAAIVSAFALTTFAFAAARPAGGKIASPRGLLISAHTLGAGISWAKKYLGIKFWRAGCPAL